MNPNDTVTITLVVQFAVAISTALGLWWRMEVVVGNKIDDAMKIPSSTAVSAQKLADFLQQQFNARSATVADSPVKRPSQAPNTAVAEVVATPTVVMVLVALVQQVLLYSLNIIKEKYDEII